MTRADGIDVSVLVVSYNTCELTLAALRSAIAETSTATAEFIVVDNASTDGSAPRIAAEFPSVHLIALDRNVGFARANNLAATVARGRYLLLLNPDTVVLDRAIDRLLAFARQRPGAGLWGGRTVFPDGTLNPASCWGRMTLWNLMCRATGLTGLLPHSPIFNGEGYGGWPRDTEREVDIVSGCFLLIERRFWSQLDGFDPLFFMYGEDADLCLRGAAAGARPAITPDAVIVHLGGASEPARAGKMIRLLTAKSSLIRRHQPRIVRPLALLLLAAWPASRVLATSVLAAVTGRADSRTAAQSWREIWSARAIWLAGFDRNAVHAPQARRGTSSVPPAQSPATLT